MDSLVGKFFHILEGPLHAYQGYVRKREEAEVYLINYFSWGDGYPTTKHLKHIDEMLNGNWVFYDSAKEMIEAHDEENQKYSPEQKREIQKSLEQKEKQQTYFTKKENKAVQVIRGVVDKIKQRESNYSILLENKWFGALGVCEVQPFDYVEIHFIVNDNWNNIQEIFLLKSQNEKELNNGC